jgi:23S rRNA pseudouridine2604 synthase
LLRNVHMKVAQYIGHSGFTSRQKAKILIDEQRVTVNGKVATQSTTFTEGDIVKVDGKNLKGVFEAPLIKTYPAKKIKPQNAKGEPTYIVYNKPKGIISTTEKIENNIIDAIGHEENILPVGRLDKDSEGLILLTNVGRIIDRIINPKFLHEKEYVVTLNLPVSSQFIKAASEGMDIGGEKTKPCEITIVPGTKRVFRIKLKQGLNRQIRRMCNKFGYQVVKLQRVSVMHIKLGNLKPGEWRNLTDDEVEALLAAIH